MNGFSKTRSLVAAFTGVAITTLLLSCSDNSSKQKRNHSQLVNVASVVNSPMSSVQILPASLEANRRVEIFNQEEGLILEIKAYQSDIVKKGQLLVRLESKLVQAELKKATISHRQAALELKRIKHLHKKRLATDEALAQAQTKLELAQAEQAALQTQFDYTLITAPFDGIISQRLKEPGDVAAKYSHILTLVDTSELKANVTLSELLLHSIKAGNTVKLQIDAVGTNNYPAVISRIYPTIDKTTRQATLEIRLENPPAAAKPGQLGRVLLDVKTTPRLHVPLSAIKHNINGAYVYKVINNKAIITQVTAGMQIGTRIEVTSNLEEGEQVVTQGFLGLSNNKAVKIAPAKNSVDKQ